MKQYHKALRHGLVTSLFAMITLAFYSGQSHAYSMQANPLKEGEEVIIYINNRLESPIKFTQSRSIIKDAKYKTGHIGGRSYFAMSRHQAKKGGHIQFYLYGMLQIPLEFYYEYYPSLGMMNVELNSVYYHLERKSCKHLASRQLVCNYNLLSSQITPTKP